MIHNVFGAVLQPIIEISSSTVFFYIFAMLFAYMLATMLSRKLNVHNDHAVCILRVTLPLFFLIAKFNNSAKFINTSTCCNTGCM